jgi:ribosome biogenesis protein MAK21
LLNDLKQGSKSKPKNKEKEKDASLRTQAHQRSSLTEHPKPLHIFTFQPVSEWHAALPPLGGPAISNTPAQLSNLSAKGAQLHENDIRAFQTSSQAGSVSSEANFLSKIINSGTLSDRLSALTLLVQSSPLHNVKALETLKSMAERGKGKGGREESLKALRCIADWWIGGGAPDRKLKYASYKISRQPECL